jgi:hypothetical protein
MIRPSPFPRRKPPTPAVEASPIVADEAAPVTPADPIVHDDDDGYDEDGRRLLYAPLVPMERPKPTILGLAKQQAQAQLIAAKPPAAIAALRIQISRLPRPAAPRPPTPASTVSASVPPRPSFPRLPVAVKRPGPSLPRPQTTAAQPKPPAPKRPPAAPLPSQVPPRPATRPAAQPTLTADDIPY